MTAVTICDTREKLQNCRFIAKKGKNLAKKGKYEPSSAFDSVTICDHCDQLIPPHTTSYRTSVRPLRHPLNTSMCRAPPQSSSTSRTVL